MTACVDHALRRNGLRILGTLDQSEAIAADADGGAFNDGVCRIGGQCRATPNENVERFAHGFVFSSGRCRCSRNRRVRASRGEANISRGAPRSTIMPSSMNTTHLAT